MAVPLQTLGGKLILGMLFGFLGGLLLGLLIVMLLHRAGLLRRNHRLLHYTVKLYWLFIPVLLALSGSQIGWVYSVRSAVDQMITANESRFRDFTDTLLGGVQTELDARLERSPELRDISINDLADVVIDRARHQLVTGATMLSLKWRLQLSSSEKLRAALHSRVVDVAHKASGVDRVLITATLDKTLGQMVDENVLSRLLRNLLHDAARKVIAAIALFSALLLLIPATEISLARWRQW
jgi:hypothetical protein